MYFCLRLFCNHLAPPFNLVLSTSFFPSRLIPTIIESLSHPRRSFRPLSAPRVSVTLFRYFVAASSSPSRVVRCFSMKNSCNGRATRALPMKNKKSRTLSLSRVSTRDDFSLLPRDFRYRVYRGSHHLFTVLNFFFCRP